MVSARSLEEQESRGNLPIKPETRTRRRVAWSYEPVDRLYQVFHFRHFQGFPSPRFVFLCFLCFLCSAGSVIHHRRRMLRNLIEFGSDDEGAANGDETQKNSSANVQKDLSDWQERHAIFVLSKVKVGNLIFIGEWD